MAKITGDSRHVDISNVIHRDDVPRESTGDDFGARTYPYGECAQGHALNIRGRCPICK